MPDGIVTDSRLIQSRNVSFPMLVAPSLMIIFLMVALSLDHGAGLSGIA